MLYQDEKQLQEIGIHWDKTIAVIEKAVKCLYENDYSQPVKPYLRYRDLKNRIIAMPAFVGGEINMSGIKWISSFPENIHKGIPRAHSVVILNEADTGKPLSVINTPLLSIIRTASVTGWVIKKSPLFRNGKKLTLGMTGFGPIGQYHLKMCQAILGDQIDTIKLYDIRPIDHDLLEDDDRVEVVQSWEDAYLNADIFMTCTVSDAPYIDKAPKAGSLHLNVSLRDYTPDAYDWFKGAMIVDDWEEVCREKTDIEMMHLEKGLEEKDTQSIVDILYHNCLDKYPPETPVLFNPMGMAVFDIALGRYYYNAALVYQHT